MLERSLPVGSMAMQPVVRQLRGQVEMHAWPKVQSDGNSCYDLEQGKSRNLPSDIFL